MKIIYTKVNDSHRIMKAFNEQTHFKNMHFWWRFNEESSLYRDQNTKKKKTNCSHMEIGISRVYDVLIVLERTVNQFCVASIFNYNFVQDH